MSDVGVKKSDLGVRTASAIVMLAVAGGALWFGPLLWIAFVTLISLGVLWEWAHLVRAFTSRDSKRSTWILAGIVYVGVSGLVLAQLPLGFEGAFLVIWLAGAVILIDVGAYCFGRTIGGPKIAPTISPSKTWAGLVGGIVGAFVALAALPLAWESGLCSVFYPPSEPPAGFIYMDGPCSGIAASYAMRREDLPETLIFGAVIAIIAQSGDFFESWMKRQAGVKDSGKLIPGHGGLFDRVDGLLAVCFAIGLLASVGYLRSFFTQ